MRIFWHLVRRDLALRFARPGEIFLPMLFFLLACILFPFAVGPDQQILARTAGGILWVAAALAALLPVDHLFEADRADGTLDQLAARGLALEQVALARWLAHWLSFAPALLLSALVGALLLKLPEAILGRALLGLALGTPALAALAVMAAALTTGIRAGGGLAGLIILPLLLPVLIFGAGLLDPFANPEEALRLLAASALLAVAACPFAAGAALRGALDA